MDKLKFKIGDTVKIIHSPYSRVNTGTITTIANIENERYGRRWTLYILNTKFNQAFYEWELVKIDEDK